MARRAVQLVISGLLVIASMTSWAIGRSEANGELKAVGVLLLIAALVTALNSIDARPRRP